MPRSQIVPTMSDSIPCPVRAVIGIALGLAISVAITRTALWVVALWVPAEILEDLQVPVYLLTGATFVAVLAAMGSLVQRTVPLRHFSGWCCDEPD